MRNPFLIIRFVFFSLLVYLNLIILIFASWNIHATTSTGLSVSRAVVFLIFNSCALFFFIVLGLAELATPHAKTAHVKFECFWSAVLSIFQIGVTISLTVNGPAIMCQASSDWGVCASLSLLVPATWLSSFMLFAYFFALFVTTAVHMRAYPDIWSQTVYSVPWFVHLHSDGVTRQKHASGSQLFEGASSDPSDGEDSWTRYLDDLEYKSTQKLQGHVKEGGQAPWAQSRNIRRGVDNPFTKREISSSANCCPPGSNAALPPLPLKVQTKGNLPGSRFVEKFRESLRISRSESPSHFGLHFSSQTGPFPPKVDDHDMPIPLPRLSEWIRADAIKGINVHTVPYSP